MSKAYSIITAALFAFANILLAPAAHPEEDRASRHADHWEDLSSPHVSSDGRWLIYSSRVRPLGSEARPVYHVTVRGTGGAPSRIYRTGSQAPRLAISTDGLRVAFRESECSTSGAGSPVRRGGVNLLEVATGEVRTLQNVAEYAFVGGVRPRLIVRNCPANGTMTDGMRLIDAMSGEDVTFEGAIDLSLDPSGNRVAYVDAGGLHMRDLRHAHSTTLSTTRPAGRTSLAWSPGGHAVAVVVASSSASSNHEGIRIIVATNLDAAYPTVLELTPDSLTGFPPTFEISGEPSSQVESEFGQSPRALVWRGDERGFFFFIRPRPPATSVESPSVAIWHSAGERLPNEEEAPSTFLSFFSLETRRFVQLGNPEFPYVAPQPRGEWALAYGTARHGWRNPHAYAPRPQLRDYALINIFTAQRQEFLQGLQVAQSGYVNISAQMSPDGNRVIFQDNAGDVVAFDVSARRQINLSAQLPARFRHNRDNTAIRQNGYLLGWSANSDYAIASDNYDIWALSTQGRRHFSMTGDAHVPGRRFRPAVATTLVSEIDLARDMAFNVTDEGSGNAGVARYDGNARRMADVFLVDALPTYIGMARDGNTIASAMSRNEPPNIHVFDVQGRVIRTLSTANRSWANAHPAPPVHRLRYTTANGDTLTAVLHLPWGYVPGRSYPTIMNIYEEGVADWNIYYPPDNQSVIRRLRRGYAILRADIRPRFGAGGQAAVEGASAALDAAIATGTVDRARVGLTGHSHGGYEVNYLIANTDLFRAAVSEAGRANLISSYGSVRATGNLPQSVNMESGQPYMLGPWWENWDAFVRNSPLFSARNIDAPFLIIHGDEDGSVAFGQALELFNTLRRMGKRNAALIEYRGEGHVLSARAARDRDSRIEEFFDHFLRGMPAPAWWQSQSSSVEPLRP